MMQPEEFDASDATCTICREEITAAKKLICGHLFHVHCLQSWLERQHTCPTCRALVVPAENGTTIAEGQQGSQSNGHQQGQTELGSEGATDSMNRHHARLQAAAAVASIYERPYVYPPATYSVRSPGYTTYPPVAESSSIVPNGEQASGEQAQQKFHNLGRPTNVPFPPMEQSLPFFHS